MLQILWLFTFTAVPIRELSADSSFAATAADQLYAHNPKDCGCNNERDWMNVWLDIIFVLDTSDGVGSDYIRNYQAVLATIAKNLVIGESNSQNREKYTRVAIISNSDKAMRLANLTTYKSGIEMQQDVSNINFMGGTLNLQLGITEAQNMIDEERIARRRLNIQKVVILYSSSSIDCSQREMTSDTKGTKMSKGVDIFCQYISRMASEGTIVMTVGVKPPNRAQYPIIRAGDKCYRLNNDESYIVNLLRSLCTANCYCPEPYIQFRDDEKCTKYGECFLLNSSPLSYDQARQVCNNLGGIIPAIENEDKKKFLQDVHTDEEKFPFWIGIQHFGDGNFYYNSGEKISPTDDFLDWCKNEPDLSKGDCVYMGLCAGFKTGWSMEKCGTLNPEHFLSCQKDACTANNFCY